MFGHCTGLASITIPHSVTSIGDYAFLECTSLINILIPDSVATIGSGSFSGCTGLASVTIPHSVTSIGDAAFSGCSGLTSITIPDSVNSIGVGAFGDCSGLTSVTIGKSVIGIGEWAFGECTSLTAIMVDALNPSYRSLDGVLFNKSQSTLIQCPSVRSGSYEIPGSVTDIESYAFYLCIGLTGVEIPDSVNTIGSYAFYACSGLTSVTIPDSVTSIGECAFSGCTGLVNATIGNNVSAINWEAFGQCTSLTSVSLGSGVTNIETAAFSGCTSLTSVTIPNSVTSLGVLSFIGCTNLTDISVDALNSRFSSLDGVLLDRNQTTLILCPEGRLGSYTIPGSVTSIGQYAFEMCTSLTNVTIPDSVDSIGNGAFARCISLIAVYFEGDAPEFLGQRAFKGTTATIYYLPGTSGWGATFGGRPTALWEVEPVPFDYTIENGTVTITGYTGPGGEVVIPGSIEGLPVTRIGDRTFDIRKDLSRVTIPDSVTFIGNEAFRSCTSLTGVTIPDRVTEIGFGVFSSCSSLASVRIPDGVTLIGFYAFYSCSSLASVRIPDGVTSIGGSAFSECASLRNITIPYSVTGIGAWAFGGCTSLDAITVDELNPVYCSLDGVLLDKSQATLITCPGALVGSYTIPHSVTRIEDAAFYNCTGLTRVTIPDNVTIIPNDAFRGCTSLTSLMIPDGIVSIWCRAFTGCTSLTSLTIPDSVTEISDNSFSLCSSLTDATFGKGLVFLGGGAFQGCDSLRAAYFKGDAPVVPPSWISDAGPMIFPPFYAPVIVFYRAGTSGWGPEFWGRPTMPWGVVWGSPVRGDVDGDEVVDRSDLDLVVASRNVHTVNSEDPRDLDGDGMITVLDARILVTLFSVPGGVLHASCSPDGIVLEWNNDGGAMKLQSTTDLQSGSWQDVGGLRSSTNAVIDTTAESRFFRLVLPE